MKKILLALFAASLFFTAADVNAESKKDRYIKKKRQEKQQEKKELRQSSSGKWHTDLQTAMRESAKTRRPIMLLITGSTWCGPCKMLEKNVLSTKFFNDYARKNLVLLKADIPRSRQSMPQETQAIVKKYGKGGVPAILILDSKGNVKESKTGYGGQTPQSFIKSFKTLKK